jgi:membrane protein YdbS with pleckstrin-like domain
MYASRAMALRLHPGERILFEGHPSWRSIIDFYAKGLLATAIVCLLAALITSDSGLVVLLAVIGVGVTILAGFIRRVATTYTITDHRLNIKRGILSREVQETRLERVQNVNYNQGALQRLLQIGDVDFDTAAGDDYNFIFFGVADPANVVHTVDQATGLAGPLGEPAYRQPVAPQPGYQTPPPPEPGYQQAPPPAGEPPTEPR